MNIEVSIIAPSALYVKQLEIQNEHPKKPVRILRRDISASDLNPEMLDLGFHIPQSHHQVKSVRLSTMRGRDWGHVLLVLQLTRAFA
ncbi:hypothetical protein [Serratia sp. 14-2641]|uniref:hypothetical protein n=1 Tax=Serratia sp. 14-2641 TaxID=1841657 RepID=UPI00080FF445|nr:hypothetical protein [Serratia sp. 14-2641]OCJ37386.1 hypothetical protein A6U95_25080 [Serratia sp. 14-2641]